MRIEKYGYTWTKKASGYYQSTTKFPDGTRHWLHQEVYSREVGTLKAGYSIHHIDEDKDNNCSSNLAQLSHEVHTKLHMKDPKRLAEASKGAIERNQAMQELAKEAKKGNYIGKAKLRKIMKGNKERVCEWCGKSFTLKVTDRNDTKYCCDYCNQCSCKSRLNPNYKPLASKLNCAVCNTTFKPVVGNQFCCSEVCRKQSTKEKVRSKLVTATCEHCGSTYEKQANSRNRQLCSDECRENYRVEVQCEICNELFEAKKKATKYCGEECVKEARRRQRKLRKSKKRNQEE